MEKVKNNKKTKNSNKKSQFLPKTTYSFTKGIPCSSNWSNHFTSLLLSEGKYLLYISNSFINVINISEKKFYQVLSSNKLTSSDKPTLLIKLNENSFCTLTLNGILIIFHLDNSENIFKEDLSKYNVNKILSNAKCGLYNNFNDILIVCNHEKICLYVFKQNEKSISFLYEIQKIKNDLIYTDMLLIENDILVLSDNYGEILIYQFDSLKNNLLLNINNNIDNLNNIKQNAIFNISYSNNLLCSINKSGTLNIYELLIDNNNIQNLKFNTKITINNKFNDKTINELYLFFSVHLINSENLLITSNEGRIFIYDIKKNSFNELAENPHKESIYTIIQNNNLNQMIFISSDYKISFFNIHNSNVLNFNFCINTIPSKIKILMNDSNNIFYLFKIHKNFYMNSYNYIKNMNTLDTIQNKILLDDEDFLINLSQLIDEERILMINKKNEIFLYNLDLNKKENKFSLLPENYLIIDIKLHNNIIYILYKEGLLIKLNIINKKVEKYKISELIEKGSIIYQNELELNNNENYILIKIVEKNSKTFKIFLFYKYYFLNIYESNLVNDNEINNSVIIQDHDLFYCYIQKCNNEMSLNILSISLSNHLNILNKEVSNYNEYLLITKELDDPNNKNLLNIKNYTYKNIFYRNDINKNNYQITDLKLNSKLNMITSFNDGSIMCYQIDIEKQKKDNYITINKIIYKFFIKANFLLTTDSIFLLNDNFESFLLATTSLEQNLKILNTDKCNILNVSFYSEEQNISKNDVVNNDNSFIMNKTFMNLFSEFFFSQSYIDAKKFWENFYVNPNIDENSIEQNIFSYYSNEEKNILSVRNTINYAKNKSIDKKNSYINKICDYFNGNVNSTDNNKIIFDVENDRDKIINTLINDNLFIECILFIKYKSFGIEVLVDCLEKIKRAIFMKQLFQVTKLEKIIQYYKNNKL